MTRTCGRFDVVAYADLYEAEPVTTTGTCTVQVQDDLYALATHARPAPARAWLTALRTGQVTTWTNDVSEYPHLKNWILATNPDGLFTATTEIGTGIGLGATANDGDGDGAADVAMLCGTRLITRPQATATVDRLRALETAWRAAGAPRAQDLTAVLVRDRDSFHVRLDLPDTGTTR
ncbi:hypothetical protein [Myceligenerans salitolerans]|uniref:Glyoxalase-like domain-containing protein n=1 Tax=Myceligenerans salitolerans TaxID=1230528 RepID=A0ABS3IBS2_9MICO|nr:hypothetical protein [Myceligenerans salitolerans]MBO0609898.1 hypothetical protein [Myceligenerans salitolerans]